MQDASGVWEGRLSGPDRECCGCPLFFQCFGRHCALKDITTGHKFCPRVLGHEDEIVRLVIRHKEMLRKYARPEDNA